MKQQKIFLKSKPLILIFTSVFLYNNTSNPEWRETWQVLYFQRKIFFEQEFGREVRGYSKAEVDEFLDDVIKDYETYAALVKSSVKRWVDLKEELSHKPQVAPINQTLLESNSFYFMTNFDI